MADSLAQLGIKHIFGIVGIPVIEVADACIARGIKFISFRNEQAASYAASIYGYLTGLPGVCLVVGGPGVLHAAAGVGNAMANHLPLLLLAGSSETHLVEKGAFQELDQVSYLRPLTKMAARPSSLQTFPALLEKAYRVSYFGRPGATYIDLPGDLIKDSISVEDVKEIRTSHHIKPPGPAPKASGDPEKIAQAVSLLSQAKTPLIIIGKGAAYGQAEESIRNFNDIVQFPFLPTPMGKGVIPDDSPLNVSACRSTALKNADVILLLGARLNWILHYGESPKFRPDAQIIQVDLAADELGNNTGCPDLGIVGDIGLVVDALSQAFKKTSASGAYFKPNQKLTKLPIPEWETVKARNIAKAQKADDDTSYPVKYQPVYRVIREVIASKVKNKLDKVVYVSEGANTMDISRSSFPLNHPRARLDAGTNATMGLGLGYAIAAKAALGSEALVVAIEGDSAFGFSGIEIETAVRSKLPIIVVVMNNSGVYHGVDPKRYEEEAPLPSTALQLETKYHLFADSLGAKGYLVKTLEEVEDAFSKAIDAYYSKGESSLLNIIIDVAKDKKLEFGWMASTKKKAKL